ncbi:MAG: SDR family oxidoreductase [Acidobacteria bacterium]|nr:MAG: SDR family oxidoreductase [Acidobacteriota bacterium]
MLLSSVIENNLRPTDLQPSGIPPLTWFARDVTMGKRRMKMSHHLSNLVVVLTGASSGIGKATALRFAENGAHLVLAGRREESLRQLADECRELGVRAIAVKTDVTDENQVIDLGRRALSEFGRIDVWVNNAGVMLYGRVEEVPASAMRRVFETNVFGHMYGARAVLPQFRRQGRGILINVASMVGKAGIAYMSAYVASKHALVGFADCLRQEVMLDKADVHVCTVMPASIDTPLFQHAANYTGQEAQPISPIYDAENVADAIIGCVQKPQREVYVGSMGRLTAFNRTFSPAMHDRVASTIAESQQFSETREPRTDGNLFQPKGPDTISGGWRQPSGVGRKVAVAALAAAVPVSLVWALKGR